MTSDSLLGKPFLGSHPFCTLALTKGPLPKCLEKEKAIRSGPLGKPSDIILVYCIFFQQLTAPINSTIQKSIFTALKKAIFNRKRAN